MFKELERNGNKKREASVLASLVFYIKCRKPTSPYFVGSSLNSLPIFTDGQGS